MATHLKHAVPHHHPTTHPAPTKEYKECELKLEEHQVIPDVLQQFTPLCDLRIGWNPKVEAKYGNLLNQADVQHRPEIIDFPGEHGKYYTILMTDPDAPSRSHPKYREFVHWALINIPGEGILKGGDEVIEWYPPSPPPGSGRHRYVFCLCRQHKKIIPGQLGLITKGDNSKRVHFKARDWIREHEMEVIAANFFYVESPSAG